MKLAIPTAEGKLCMHFGHCEVFTVIDIDTASKEVVSSEEKIPPPHEPGVLPKWLHEQGVEVIIAGGMGMRAQQLFAQAGVDVIVGAPSGSPEDIAQHFMNNTLETGDNVCDH